MRQLILLHVTSDKYGTYSYIFEIYFNLFPNCVMDLTKISLTLLHSLRLVLEH
uniref:Uncharacterized protein n=1 Tax=Nelumbo nucifera TaxID=4432 RepID=A0A822XIY2_NELNU|nr:TPA_asm: hypothetical protein HUJ06_021126 [Nelumbo nucifera]